MSHRWDCPSRWEAEREGERDYERRGYRSYDNPYEERLGDEGCPEAARAYADGQRHAEYRAEEEAAERRMEERQAEARRYEREQQEYFEQQQWEEQQQMQQAEHEYWEGQADLHYAMLDVEDLHNQF